MRGLGLFLLLFAVLITSFSTFAIMTSHTSNSFDVNGTIVNYDKVYIAVRNVSGRTLSAGMFVRDYDGNGAGVTATNTIYQRPLCMLTKDVADDGYTNKCQVFGYGNALLVGDATAGLSAYTTTTIGKVIGAESPVATQYPVGSFLESTTSSPGDANIFIRLL